MSSHFQICVLSRERPLDTSLLVVSALLPCIDFTGECVTVGQAPIQALTVKNANFDFRHIQPTGVHRRVVKDDAPQERVGGLDTKHLLEAFAEMRVEFVEHQVDAACRCIDDAGVNSGKPYVIVPTGNAVFAMDRGARLYFQMRYFGVPHNQIAILNGGTNAWLNAGLPVSTQHLKTAKGDWKAIGQEKAILATTAEVKEGLKSGSQQYIDARPTAQFLGIAKKPIDKTAGHLPGAKSFPIDAIVKDEHGATLFMTAADYKKIFHDTNISDNAPTTTYCNTGHLASGAWFVVHEIMGNKNSKMYAGSMNEWTNLGNPTVGLPG